MTILSALSGYYDRMAERGDVPPYGYSAVRIAFALVLSETGDVVQVMDFRRGRDIAEINVPQPAKRTSAPIPSFLWDNTKFVLGVGLGADRKTPRKTPVHAEAFAGFHREALGGSDDPGLRAVLAFLERRGGGAAALRQEQVRDMLEKNVAFMLDGDVDGYGRPRFVHDRPAAREAWGALLRARASDGVAGTCCVTGAEGPIARLHPSVKGVMGAQSSGASIVSFNADAFASYGLSQGDNAPVSEVVAFKYGAALNRMLSRGSGHSMAVGNMTLAFWCDASEVGETAAAAAEETCGHLLDCVEWGKADDGKETAVLREDVARLARGEEVRDVRPEIDPATRMFVLGLSPNASRIYPRLWLREDFGTLYANVRRHWDDTRVAPPPLRTGHAVPLWMLVNETALGRKGANVAPGLAGEVARAMLTGERYPETLLSAVVARIRADGEVNGVRAAACRACVVRHDRIASGNEKETLPTMIDKTETNPAYRLGRLFAVLEAIQRAALGRGVNATVKDKFYGSASATPAGVFPVLLRGAQAHISKIGKDMPGYSYRLEEAIGEILEPFGSGFPRTLTIEDQGRFAVGFYHQRNAPPCRRNGDADAPEEPGASAAHDDEP